MTKQHAEIFQFMLPQKLACPLPTEERGLNRDDVRLMVSNHDGQTINHRGFYDLDEVLDAGDVLVVNTSATIPAALPLVLPDGAEARLHLSTQLAKKRWLVEIRSVSQNNTRRWTSGAPGQSFELPGGASLQLETPFYQDAQLLHLWEATLEVPQPLSEYLQQFARPVKYQNINKPYPIAYYQTYFGQQAGSTEMPSAARGFTEELVQKLLKKGVQIVPILLHTGVSSLEVNEHPYPEYLEISRLSSQQINIAKQQNKRIIVVGTTAVRALESATDNAGTVQPYQGLTELYIQSNYKMKVANGLLTGFHEPEASHLHMLQAIASKRHLRLAYQAALQQQYYWHEFGDLHLILNDPKKSSWWPMAPEYLAKPLDLPRK
ncbi:MAG: S-adenosylmethionine:tRNA ribosyltransferase-isomerase [Bacteroidota bacterium]